MGNLKDAVTALSGDSSEFVDNGKHCELHASHEAIRDSGRPPKRKVRRKQSIYEERAKQKNAIKDTKVLPTTEKAFSASNGEFDDDVGSSGDINNGHKLHCASSASSNYQPQPPYKLQAIGHSLGGAALLIYVVMSRRKQIAHRLHKLVLLTPAGFHHQYPPVARPFIYFLPFVEFVWRRIFRLKVCDRAKHGLDSVKAINKVDLRCALFHVTTNLQINI